MNNNHVDAIRQAALTDLDAIMPLFDAARAFMIKAGNPNQWINGYPERKLIESEIEQGHCRGQRKKGDGRAQGGTGQMDMTHRHLVFFTKV